MTKYAPDEVERYLADQLPQHEVALRRVGQILTKELGVEPVISYQILGWKIQGKYAIYLSGWKDHLSFHGGHYLEPLAEQFPQWFKRKGATLWFQAEPELPVEVIKAVIAARLASLDDQANSDLRYKEMANDQARNAEAKEWEEALAGAE